MTSIVVLVGRPNVGKSTLFNRLTGRRDALVADVPGLTRDRRYGSALVGDRRCTVVDTGGLFAESDAIAELMTKQVDVAIGEADLVLFVVDARAGRVALDDEIATKLRRAGVSPIVVANKIDGAREDVAMAEFHALGFAEVVAISAAHGRGIAQLDEAIGRALCDDDGAHDEETDRDATAESTRDPDRIRLAVVGRPNVGKSTLVNRWLGEERVIVFEEPGTTRDAVEIKFDHRFGKFVLIDTAGIRRKGRVDAAIEKFSVVKSLAAMESADVAVLLIDAQEGLVEQDLHVLDYAIQAGVGLVLAVNKWDGRTQDERDRVKQSLDRRLDFAPWIPIRFVSALHGTAVPALLEDATRIHRAATREMPTHELTAILERSVESHAPPTVRGRQIKLRYAHKIADRPPTILIHGNQTRSVPASYERYLEKQFREALGLEGMPVRLEFRTGDNPFAGRRNTLTPRQRRRRERIQRHGRR